MVASAQGVQSNGPAGLKSKLPVQVDFGNEGGRVLRINGKGEGPNGTFTVTSGNIGLYP